MATWTAVKAYLRGNYIIEDEPIDDLVIMLFDTGSGRDQRVYVGRDTLAADGTEWLKVASVVGQVDRLDTRRALHLASSAVCGGLQLIEDLLAVVHWQPLANVDQNEIDVPIQLAVTTADALEQALTGSDRF